MILNLIEGIKTALTEEWDIPVYTEILTETETEAPYFLITVSSSEEKSLMGDRCVRQIQVDIHYHPDNSNGYYEIAERLFDITNMVSLPDGGNGRGQNKKFEFTDGVIIFHVNFDFIMTVETEIDEENLMGTIDSQTGLVSI